MDPLDRPKFVGAIGMGDVEGRSDSRHLLSPEAQVLLAEWERGRDFRAERAAECDAHNQTGPKRRIKKK